MKFDIAVFKKSVHKIQFSLKSVKNNVMVTWLEDIFTFPTESHRIILRNV